MFKVLIGKAASASAISIALATMPVAAMAQEADEASPAVGAIADGEIVVTAQRRAERSVDVPITVTSLDAGQLTTGNARELADISKLTPSLRFDSAGAFTQPTIRGIGTAVATSGGGGNVGIYIDGFYSPNPLAANSQLMNVESVQVLKGPQGTLFGRNTTGGAILIQTAQPSEETEGQFRLSYGRFNEVSAQFYGTTGIAEGVAFDIEGLYRHGKGFQTNIVNNDDSVGEHHAYSVRAGLKFNIGEFGSLLLRYGYAEQDDPRPVVYNTYVDPVLGVGTGPGAVLGVDYVTDPDLVALDRPTFLKMKSHTVQATLELDLGFADLTSYSQYRTEDVNQSQDLDGTAAPLQDPQILPRFNIGIPVKNETVSQEFLLNSKPGGPLQWTAGLFYFSNKDRYQTFYDMGGAFRDPTGPNRAGGSSTTTKSYAAFIDATYELTPQLFVTAGARYAHDTVTNASFVRGPATNRVPGLVETFAIPSIKNDKVTPRFVLRYKPTEQASIYASYTQGYKSAVIDAGGTCQNPPDFVCNDIEPEQVHAYEVGAKFSNGVLSLEAAGFYYDYKNLQVSSFLGDGRAQITNAANSEIYGVEGSARIRVTSQFDINAGAAWTHARYKTFNNAPVYERGGPAFIIPAGTTLTNVPMQRTPEFTGNIGASYRTDLGGGELQFSGNLYYTSKFYFGPSGTQFPQKAYETATARVQWTDPSDSYTLAIWGDNLTNNRHLNAVQYNSFGLGASWNAPVTYGVEFGFRF